MSLRTCSTGRSKHNTLTRAKEEFAPADGQHVKMYCCGPTVYNYAHIGNLRTYVFEDLLHRTLKWHGWGLTHVMNITDVGHMTSDSDTGEDKMQKAAARENRSPPGSSPASTKKPSSTTAPG